LRLIVTVLSVSAPMCLPASRAIYRT
jgi:hypothetical protein